MVTVRAGLGNMDVLKATLLSGAPKVLALESSRNWSRPGATSRRRDRLDRLVRDASIVCDSDPAAEWEETMNKGRALCRAAAQEL